MPYFVKVTLQGVNLSDKTADGPLTNPLGAKQSRGAGRREIWGSAIDWRDAVVGATDA